MIIRDESMEYRHENGVVEFWVFRNGISGSYLLYPEEDATEEDIESMISDKLAEVNI